MRPARRVAQSGQFAGMCRPKPPNNEAVAGMAHTGQRSKAKMLLRSAKGLSATSPKSRFVDIFQGCGGGIPMLLEREAPLDALLAAAHRAAAGRGSMVLLGGEA